MKRKLMIYFIVLMCFFSFLCSGIINTYAAVSKYKIDYPTAVRVNVDRLSSFYLLTDDYDIDNPMLIKISKVTSNDKHLIARVDKNNTAYSTNQIIELFGTKKGTYSLKVTVKIRKTGKKDQKETIKIPVYVGYVNPIKEIRIGGKKLVAIENKEYSVFNALYSEKSKGNMNVTMNKNFIIKNIEIHGTDRDLQNMDSPKSPYYNRGSKKMRIKNGEKVTLNNQAKGETWQTYFDSDSQSFNDYWSPVYTSKEVFNFRTAATYITIIYYDKPTDKEQRITFVVYTKSKTI